MKKRTRIVIVFILLAALVFGYVRVRNHLRDEMQGTLRARYPTDSFTVDNVRLTVLPLGAEGLAHARHEDLDFTVRFIKGLGEEDEVTDEFYKARSLKHYDSLLETRMERYEDLIAAYYLEPIIIGNASLDAETGFYPAVVHIMLDPEISTSAEFLTTAKEIADSLHSNPPEGIDAYHFVSFPGSVYESDLRSIGLEPALLTRPTPTPAPTPTPRPTVAGTGTETGLTTEEPTTTSATDEEREQAKPAFAYEITILTDNFRTDESLLRNGLRTVTYTSRELQRLAATYQLDSEQADLLDNARSRQTADVAITGRTTVTSSATSTR